MAKPSFLPRLMSSSLVLQIAVGLLLGIVFALVAPSWAAASGFLGTLFVSALKAVAPVLVLVLVISAICNQKSVASEKGPIKTIVVVYLIGTFAAAATAVAASFLFPVTLDLPSTADKLAAPGGIGEVLRNLVLSVVDNPVKALMNANYIGILAWAISLGMILRHSNDATRNTIFDVSKAVEGLVRLVIRFAPIGVFGLVASTLATEGFAALWGYARLLCVLIGCMIFVALVLNPLIVWLVARRNPYPLVLRCLRESGVTAFFMRSSAANIPVNLNLCRSLKLPEGVS
ncbi:MAG: serine/threonine transporter SstT, partial [Duodenibacillus sp.]|nr:serine/threonine transporter SstT [Duodenibacillus sp.]